MDLPFLDPTEAPRPPGETRFRGVRVEPYADGSRFRLDLRLTPFERRPDIDIIVCDSQGVQVASATVVEAFAPRLSLTMHLPLGSPPGPYSARLLLRYRELDVVDRAQVTFSMIGGNPSRQETDADAG